MSLDGIVLVHKPQGISTFNCSYKVQETIKDTPISHIEAMESRVEGVLPVFVGKATRLLRLFRGGMREYLCEITLGFSTTTEDASGDVEQRREMKRKPSVKQVEKALESMRGAHQQIAPMYSAASYEGKKLHQYLEEGTIVPEEERPIRAIDVLDIALESEVVRTETTATFSIYVKCTDGTFIRSLAATIGQRLNYPAHLSKLTRLSVGAFHLSNATDYETLPLKLSVLTSADKSGGRIKFNHKGSPSWFITFEEMLSPYKKVTATDEALNKIGHRRISKKGNLTKAIDGDEPFVVQSKSGQPLAIYVNEKDSGYYYRLASLVDK